MELGSSLCKIKSFSSGKKLQETQEISVAKETEYISQKKLLLHNFIIHCQSLWIGRVTFVLSIRLFFVRVTFGPTTGLQQNTLSCSI